MSSFETLLSVLPAAAGGVAAVVGGVVVEDVVAGGVVAAGGGVVDTVAFETFLLLWSCSSFSFF